MARDFNGSSDYLDAGNPSALDLTGDEVTLSMWIKRASSSGAKIFSKWRGSPAGFQYLLEIGAAPLFAIFNGGTIIANGSTTLSVDVWYHIAGVYDGSEMRVYVDGVEDGSTANTGSMSSTTVPVRIGSGSGDGQDLFNGEIGHCAIWDVGLSASEIESLAAGINPLSIRRGNLLSYWPLNGQSTEPDVVGGHNMTVNGAVTAEEPPIPNSIVAP